MDDAIAIAESPVELQAINATLSGACDTWRCQFAEGKKKPRFMACGPQPLPLLEGACGALCGQIPAQVDQIKVLGILLDSQLSFLPLFSQAVAELQTIGGKLASGLSSHGFGLPAVASQFMTRVLPAALHGCELLISSNLEWTQVAKQLNEAQYIVAKTFLGCPKTAHLGSHVAVLAETRLLTRAGTWLAKNIIMARARLACLPDIHPAKRVAQGIQRAGIPDTWLHHSASVLRYFQIGWDLWDPTYSIPCEVFESVKARRNFLRQYGKHVQPFLLSSDFEWFKNALAVLNSEGLIPYVDIIPLHQPWAAKEQWKTWPVSLWQAHRIWSVARIIGGAPILSEVSGGFIAIFSLCPFCHHRAIGLQHMMTTCPGTIDLRRNLPDPNVDPRILLKAALTYPGNEKDLIAQVILVSSAVARFATAFDLSTI